MMRLLNILLIFLYLVFIGCERIETTKIKYPDFESAVEAGAIGEGKLLPTFLPRSARDIEKLFNIDTNEIWLSFNFNSIDLVTLLQSCNRISQAEVVYPRKGLSKWPQALTVNAHDKKNDPIYEYYRCKDDGFIAIKNEAFYWHTGAGR